MAVAGKYFFLYIHIKDSKGENPYMQIKDNK